MRRAPGYGGAGNGDKQIKPRMVQVLDMLCGVPIRAVERNFSLAWRSYHRPHVVPPGGHCPSRRCQWPSGMARGWQKIRVSAAPPVSCLETHV